MSMERTILADLVLDSALHIGQGKGGDPTDSPLRRTVSGQLFISGRAIGGSLRTLATRLAPRLGLPACRGLREKEPLLLEKNGGQACLCPVCRLFGDLYPDERGGKQGGDASRLWIADAYSVESFRPTHVRDGVGLGRRNRAAARNVKFDYEIMPAGATFALRLRLTDNDSDGGAAQRAMLLAATLAEWEAGRGQLGGGSARGLGRFHLEKLHCRQNQLATKEALLAYLQDDAPWQSAAEDAQWLTGRLAQAQQAAAGAGPAPVELPVARSFIRLSFTIGLESLFLSNDPLAALLSGFDHAPLVEVALTAHHQAGMPVLSGAGLRGALRARAEKVARTLASLKWSERATFLNHCPACDPLVAADYEPLAACDRRLLLPDEAETPAEALCLACRLFGSSHRGSRLRLSDGRWQGPPLDASTTKVQDFLAIDRFTGGGQTSAKFDAAPLAGGRFTAEMILEAPEAWELGWLALLLRDLAEGELLLGFGAAKGYGRARATDFDWQVGFLQPADFPGDSTLLAGATASGVYQLVVASAETGGWLPFGWREQANDWVRAFVGQVEGFERNQHWQPFKDDSYFDSEGRLATLYGLPTVEVQP